MVKFGGKTDEFSLLLHLIVPSACTGHQIPLLMTCLGLPAGKVAFSSSNLSIWLDIGWESPKKWMLCFFKMLVQLECTEWQCGSCFCALEPVISFFFSCFILFLSVFLTYVRCEGQVPSASRVSIRAQFLCSVHKRRTGIRLNQNIY